MKALCVGGALAVAVGVCFGMRALSVHVAQPAWEVMRRQTVPPPCPARAWNPFALRGSGPGQTFSRMVIEAADRPQHLGIYHHPIKALTPVAALLGQAKEELMPKGHFHAEQVAEFLGEGLAEGPAHAPAPLHQDDHADGDHDGDAHEQEHDHNPVAERKMARAAAHAVLQVRELSKWAYLLDPGNVAALQCYLDWVLKDRQPVDVVLADGAKRTLTAGQWRALQLCNFSLSRLDLRTGHRPDHCLAAVRISMVAWNTESDRERFDTESAEERARRFAHLANLVVEWKQLVALGNEQLEVLGKTGQFERWPEAERAALLSQVREAGGLIREAEAAVARERGGRRSGGV